MDSGEDDAAGGADVDASAGDKTEPIGMDLDSQMRDTESDIGMDLDSQILAKQYGVRLLPSRYSTEYTVVVHGTHNVEGRLGHMNRFLRGLRAR